MGNVPFESVIFDLDGVITKTALVHGAAWKATFDEYMKMREKRDNEPFKEFTHEHDYLPYVDGKPRYEGVKSFLESRGINIPYGDPSDKPDTETVCGVGNRKNEMFVKILKEKGVEVYTSTVELIKELIGMGVQIGVASSSKNCKLILEKAGIEDLFETRVDGVVSAEIGLKGKPEGDIFVTAARNLGCEPSKSIVVEDATSGVAAGRNGGFGLVLGIAREKNENDLLKHGADIVVTDLEYINQDILKKWFGKKPPHLFDNWDELKDTSEFANIDNVLLNECYKKSGKDSLVNDKDLVFFLDYDGTLTPIVDKPDMAIVSEEMKQTVIKLSEKVTVAIVSGRFREDVENLLGIKGLFYAGSHGFDINGPDFSMVEPRAQEAIPKVAELTEKIKASLADIPGLLVEEKKFSVAVHYRLVNEDEFLTKIQEYVENVIKDYPMLRLMHGKKVFELLPAIEWDKGKAIRWLMQTFKLSWDKCQVVYIGDDVTDENAFRAIRTRGTAILVSEEDTASTAHFKLNSPEQVKELFEKIIATT